MSSNNADMMVGNRLLSSLRVVDLKQELEKRGLSKSGSKKDLADRLRLHLQIERHRDTGASADEEELPNYSVHDELADQNPFVREYLASQAELFHSQKVVKKLVEEEAKRESETSADESVDSPVKPPAPSPIISPVLQRSSPKDPVPVVTPTETRRQSRRRADSQREELIMTADKLTTRSSRSRSPIRQDIPVKEIENKEMPVFEPEVKPEKSPEKNKESVVKSPEKKTPSDVSGKEAFEFGKGDDEDNKEADKGFALTRRNLSSRNKPTTAPPIIKPSVEPDENQVTVKPELLNVQDKLTDQNALVRENLASPPQQVHSQKLVKNLVEEEAKREPEKIAHESVVSPVKQPSTTEERSPIRQETPEKKTENKEIPVVEPEVKPEKSPEKNKESVVKSPEKKPVSDVAGKDDDEDRNEAKLASKNKEITTPPTNKSNAETDGKQLDAKSELLHVQDKLADQNTLVKENLASQAEQLHSEKVVKKRVEEEAKRESETESSADESEDSPVTPPSEPSPEERSPIREEVHAKEIENKEISVVEPEVTPEKSPEKNKESVKSPEKKALSDVAGEEALDYGEDDDEDRNEADKEFAFTRRNLSLKNKATTAPPTIRWSVDTDGKLIVKSESLNKFYEDIRLIPLEQLKLEEKANETAEAKAIDRKPSINQELIDPDEPLPTRTVENIQPQPLIKRTVSIISSSKVPSEGTEEIDKTLTPPRNPQSNVLLITNLVRPFTLPQLKEMLQRTGNLQDIWVDKIKSKCIAKFDSQEEAFETRAALHGVRWPSSNPKSLHVDYTTLENLDDHKAKDSGEQNNSVTEKPVTAQPVPVREWDMGKKAEPKSPGRSRKRSRSRSRDRDRDHKRSRRSSSPGRRRHSKSPAHERRSRGGEGKEPEPIGKALDELFRKTIAAPSIYWLPLTPAQIAEKEELRRKRMIERERRLAELNKIRPR